MSASVKWEGLDQLRAELRQLPEALAEEAGGIVEFHAQSAKTEIQAAYPERTGNLRSHVTVALRASSKYGAGVILKNTAKHAVIFEHGTQARHTDIGANRGTMPAGNVFIPRVIKWRRRMYAALAAMLVRHGLTVSGDAAA